MILSYVKSSSFGISSLISCRSFSWISLLSVSSFKAAEIAELDVSKPSVNLEFHNQINFKTHDKISHRLKMKLHDLQDRDLHSCT
jgi:hypothetical protein